MYVNDLASIPSFVKKSTKYFEFTSLTNTHAHTHIHTHTSGRIIMAFDKNAF